MTFTHIGADHPHSQNCAKFNAINFPCYWPVFHRAVAECYQDIPADQLTTMHVTGYIVSIHKATKYKLEIITGKFENTDENITKVLSKFGGRAVFFDGEFAFKYKADYQDAVKEYTNLLAPSVLTIELLGNHDDAVY